MSGVSSRSLRTMSIRWAWDDLSFLWPRNTSTRRLRITTQTVSATKNVTTKKHHLRSLSAATVALSLVDDCVDGGVRLFIECLSPGVELLMARDSVLDVSSLWVDVLLLVCVCSVTSGRPPKQEVCWEGRGNYIGSVRCCSQIHPLFREKVVET